MWELLLPCCTVDSVHVLTLTDVQDYPAGSSHQGQGDISALCRVIMSGCSLFYQRWDGASVLKGNFFTLTGLFGQRQSDVSVITPRSAVANRRG